MRFLKIGLSKVPIRNMCSICVERNFKITFTISTQKCCYKRTEKSTYFKTKNCSRFTKSKNQI